MLELLVSSDTESKNKGAIRERNVQGSDVRAQRSHDTVQHTPDRHGDGVRNTPDRRTDNSSINQSHLTPRSSYGNNMPEGNKQTYRPIGLGRGRSLHLLKKDSSPDQSIKDEIFKSLLDKSPRGTSCKKFEGKVYNVTDIESDYETISKPKKRTSKGPKASETEG